ncbi:MAG: hypothetical protein JSW60_09055, partial [Thermoplasmatales archaeon]
MEVIKESSLIYNKKTYNLKVISIVIVSLIIVSLFMTIEGTSSPIIIDEDSGGSWSDSFEDEEGIEEYHNLTIENGCVSLGYVGGFDGTNWIRHGLVIDNGVVNDSVYADNPCILKEENKYKMWYRGGDGTESVIIYATSDDGINWTKEGVVLVKGNPGDYDSLLVKLPVVIKDNGIYKMWYTGDDGSAERILYANSTDGINWSKQGLVMNGTPGWSDQSDVACNTIIKETDGSYKMWYQGFDGSNWRIFYATSTNGMDWLKQGMVLNIGNPGDWDDTHITDAAVIKENDNLYRMWYNGHDGSSGYRIFYTISNDEKNWNKQGLALNWGDPGELDDAGVSYCHILKDDDGFYKMWYGGNNGGPKVRIFYATSPYPFDNGNLTSIKISLPQGQTWDTLIIDKTEPGIDNYINVTILNGETNEPIPGFENLTNITIDISSLDYIAYPTIKLYASFVGDGLTTPVLNEWTVTWLDTFPPKTPSGLAVSNPWTGYSLILSWHSNSEHDLAHYVLHYSTDNNTFYLVTNISA